MTKVLVISFLNTLIDNEEAISTSTMLEIDKLKQDGVKLVIITNRLIDDVLYYNESYPFIDYIISLNGGVIYDVNNNKYIYGKTLDDEQVNKIEEEYKNNQIVYYSDNNSSMDRLDNIYKIEVKLKKRINNSEYPILKVDKDYYLEISNNNSYYALIKILKDNNYKLDDVFAIIGNMSEEQFISKIDNCYVVSNAFKELKNKTKKRTKSNNAKGVLYILKKIFK